MNKENRRAASTCSGGSSSLCWMIFWMVLAKNRFIVSRLWFGRIRTRGAMNGKATGHRKPGELVYRLRLTRRQYKNIFCKKKKKEVFNSQNKSMRGLKNEKEKNSLAWRTKGSSTWFWESTWVPKATLAMTSMVKQPKHLQETHSQATPTRVGTDRLRWNNYL